MSLPTLDAAVVSTIHGDVRGSEFLTASVVGNAVFDRVFTFKGIPYAAPPVGDLRWRPPQDPDSWAGVRDVTEYGPACIQDPNAQSPPDPLYRELSPPTNSSSEDCLFLNVYTPNVSVTANLPVMVWIHGGGMVRGTGARYPAEIPTSLHNVVMVTINYRLGNLGFLPTRADDAPGNFGLLDAMKALQWVQADIRNFGGDPDRVTIFGQSGGGWAVSLLVMSPMATGLFHRAISQSGVAGIAITQKGDLTQTETLAAGLNCSTASYDDMMSCLRGKPSGAIATRTTATALIGGRFLPESPWDMMFKNRINRVDYLLGTNNDENAFRDNDGLTRQEFEFRLSFSLRRIAAQYLGGMVNEILQPVIDQYVDPASADDPIYLRDQFVKQATDSTFAAPTVMMAQAASAYGRDHVYQYEFQRPSSVFTYRPSYIRADHGDELFYMFGIPLLRDVTGNSWKYSFTQEERDLSLDMMAYWVNFATNGDPNDSSGAARMRDLVTWPRYMASSQSYLQLDVTSSTSARLREDLLKFWNEEVPRLLGKHVHVHPGVRSGDSGGPSRSHFVLAFLFVVSYLFA
ncbi:fatty acyl-CoA hydrolase precursor, medium chain-like [Branchiostoma lanceolatum]|uniref:fatty acyl-CoA hydrolase precursor, medium chain-like n=1 Tax=Branchiostoma lanceolatum TaxID=7740 RepID=UPI003452377C